MSTHAQIKRLEDTVYKNPAITTELQFQLTVLDSMKSQLAEAEKERAVALATTGKEAASLGWKEATLGLLAIIGFAAVLRRVFLMLFYF